MAIKKGRVQRSSAIDTKERSFTTSETRVIANIVTIPRTVDGMVRRLVWKVLNL